MSDRKQSITTDQIVERSPNTSLPAAGAPSISNYEYSGTALEEVTEEVNDPTEVDETLSAPSNIEIVSQTVKFAPDGTQYVTVVIEFDEVEGSSGYESRLAKV